MLWNAKLLSAKVTLAGLLKLLLLGVSAFFSSAGSYLGAKSKFLGLVLVWVISVPTVICLWKPSKNLMPQDQHPWAGLVHCSECVLKVCEDFQKPSQALLETEKRGWFQRALGSSPQCANWTSLCFASWHPVSYMGFAYWVSSKVFFNRNQGPDFLETGTGS